jgi:hypothetical protein
MERVAFLIALTAAAGLSVAAPASSQTLRATPNIPSVILKKATCTSALTPTPGAVGDRQTYTCESGPAACITGWTPVYPHVVNYALVYNCVPNSQIIK